MNNQGAAAVGNSDVSFIPLRKTPGPMKARYQVNNTTDSLELRCCKIIAANLERYPVEAIGVLDEEGWNAVVRERHSGTAPTKGKGGLDGTGRMAPAMKAQFLEKIEEANPHLAESAVADNLVWRDCVEFKFTAGGVERPESLKYPWPVLVERVQKSGSDLLGLLDREEITETDRGTLEQSIISLKGAPMNVNLLQSSGAGKLLKKFIKGCSKRQETASSLRVKVERPIGPSSLTGKPRRMLSPLGDLEQLLVDWKEMAAKRGMKIAGLKLPDQVNESDGEDAKMAETCQTWRSLYHALEIRKTTRLADQGARMRERKRKLDTDRAKIRKVQHAKPKPQHERILNRPLDRRKQPTTANSWGGQAKTGNSKIMELKRQAAVVVGRQGKALSGIATKPKAAFSNAVAFPNAFKPKESIKRKPETTIVQLNGGKQMKMPTKTVNQNELRTKGIQKTFEKRGR
jgi:hypothetical protein